MVLQEQVVLLVHRELAVLQGHQELQDHQELRVLQELQVLQVLLV